MNGFDDPLKTGFGKYLHSFYTQLVPHTPALVEYADRATTQGFAKCAVWAPGRMVDQVQDMLTAWRKNDTSGTADATPYLPILIAAMSKDFVPAPPDFSRPLSEDVDVIIPADPLQRVFKMRAIMVEKRVQVAICAADQATAGSIAAQLDLFAKQMINRRFYASYPLAGFDEPWPVVLELPDLQAINVPPDEDVKNLTILTVDISLRATIPMLRYPAGVDPNDGQGQGTAADPHGYLVVRRAEGLNAPFPGAAHPTTWSRGT